MAPRNVTIQPRKTPRQQRSRATCDAILQATARILERGGGDTLTTNQVAEVAGVSIGSLYQYYPTKQAILAELIRQMRQEMHDDLVAAAVAACDQGLEAEVDALVAATLRHHLRNPGLAQVLEHFEDQLPMDNETARLKREMAGIVIAMLTRYGIDEPQATAFDLIAIGHGLAHAHISAGPCDFDVLHGRMRRAVLGYLSN